MGDQTRNRPFYIPFLPPKPPSPRPPHLHPLPVTDQSASSCPIRQKLLQAKNPNVPVQTRLCVSTAAMNFGFAKLGYLFGLVTCCFMICVLPPGEANFVGIAMFVSMDTRTSTNRHPRRSCKLQLATHEKLVGDVFLLILVSF